MTMATAASAAAPMAQSAPAVIEMIGVSKWYSPTFQVLSNCTAKVEKGEVVVVCGPSGSGKSTLIKCVNALEPFQQGDIYVTGVKVNDPSTNLPSLARPHRHGVSAFRAVSAPKRHGKSMPGAAESVAPEQRGVRCEGYETSGPRRTRRSSPEISGAAFRRTAAARCDCACSCHGANRHAVRRADFGARSRNGERGA